MWVSTLTVVQVAVGPYPFSIFCEGEFGNAAGADQGINNGVQWNYYPAFPANFTSFGTMYNKSYDVIGGYLNVGYDAALYVRCYATQNYNGATAYGSVFYVKTNALAASASAPTVANLAAYSVDVSCNFVANVLSSSCTAQLQYKRTVDATWTNFGATGSGTGSGTSSIGPRTLTGLQSSTSYDFRVVLSRTTNNATSAVGPVASFTTLAGIPEVTTTPATSISAASARLNANLTINAGTNTAIYWKWGTDNPPTQNTTASLPGVSDGGYNIGIIGLNQSETYYVQAFASFNTPAGSPVSGGVISFNTPADPLADAVEEDHMHIYEYDGKYGAEKTIYFTLQSPATTSSDRLVTTDPATLFAAGDIKVSKDGGAFANVSNSVTQVAASNPLYKLVLTAAEMQAEDLVVQIVDQNGPAFRDAYIHVRTKLQLGQMNVDASALTNANAVTFTGQGSGHGLEAIGGATGVDIKGIMAENYQRVSVCQTNAVGTVVKLDASASATNDYYNGSIVMIVDGTGAGQARIITDYDGTTKEATVDTAWASIPTAGSIALITGGSRAWDLAPDAELATVPSATGTYGLKLQFLFQRFAFKITQTATLQTWYKANSSTALASRSVDDDGTTQLLAKLT